MNKRILSKAMAILLLTGLLVSFISLGSTQTGKVAAQQTRPPKFEANVPVRGTYLFADNDVFEWDDNGDGVMEKHSLEAPLIVDLAANGFTPGDLIKLNATGAVHYVANGDWNLFWSGASQLWGVFSSTNTILWQSQGNKMGPLHRVPGAIDAGAPSESWPTTSGYSTDIPEDFFVPEEGARIRIPQGAVYLMLSGSSSTFTDNEGWIKVTIEKSQDSDGDGLFDDWEQNGIDYDNDGTIDLDLKVLGADWQHKDLFVEVDYMQGHFPDPDAMSDVVSAFANAPINNIDNMPGVKLHVDVGDSIPHQDVIKTFDDFDTLKNEYFGTPEQRSDANIWNILDAKALVYRYCLVANQYSKNDTGTWTATNSSGIAELWGNDFIVSLGSFTNGKGTRDEQAGTFMHELGHTLNLGHGGGDEINYKPNYLSIMNYAFQFSDEVGWRPLDYSHKTLPTLNERSLDESLGIQYSGFWLYTIWNWSDNGVAGTYSVGLANGPLDWNGNYTTEYLVRLNVNNFPKWEYSSPPDESLAGYDDWANLKYSFLDSKNFEDGVHSQVVDQEITWEIVEAMRETQSIGVDPTSPAPSATVSPQASPGRQSASWLTNTNYLVIGAVVAAVAVVAVVFIALRKRKRH